MKRWLVVMILLLLVPTQAAAQGTVALQQAITRIRAWIENHENSSNPHPNLKAYQTVQDEASNLAQRSTLNFTGAGASCVDNPGSARTDCTITSGGGVSDGDKGDITVSGGGATWTIDGDVVDDAKLRNSAATSVIGRSAGSTGDPGDISAGADGDVLRRAGGALGFGAVPESSVTGLISDLAAKVPTSRLINTTSPLAGGGDLSGDRTLSLQASAASRLFGRGSAGGAGNAEEITLGSRLTLAGTVLSADLQQAYSTVQDDGTPRTQRTTVNFIGSAISCVDNGGTSTTDCTVSAGGGSGNFLEISLAVSGTFTSATITGQAWVTASSVVVCSSFGTTADGNSPETAALASFSTSVSSRVAGTGFTFQVFSPNGAEGTFRFHCTGSS